MVTADIITLFISTQLNSAAISMLVKTLVTRSYSKRLNDLLRTKSDTYHSIFNSIIKGSFQTMISTHIPSQYEDRVAHELDPTEPYPIGRGSWDNVEQTGDPTDPQFLDPNHNSQTMCDNPDPPPNPVGPEVTSWEQPWDDGYPIGSPLVMDLSSGGSGISLAALNSSGSVYWDIASEGFKHASGWVSGDTGLLCIDVNSNGTIDDNSELFGNYGPNYNFLGSPPSANGFDTLAAYDSNSDGHITSSDTQFGDLRVWTDDNHDGVSQSTELHTLSDLNITSIDLGYSNVNYDISGNTIKQESTFTMNGDTRTIADAWFAYDTSNTVYNGTYTLDEDTLTLPDQRGYGLLPDLHIAMSNDSTLLGLVQDLAGNSAAELLDPSYNLDQKVEAILFQWAGVEGVDPDLSHSPFNSHFDAQKLAFLEQLMDQSFQDNGDPSQVGTYNVGYLTTAWDNAFSYLSAHILAQAGLNEIMGSPFYDLSSDTLIGGSADTADIAIHYASQATTGGGLSGVAAEDVYIFRPGDAPTSTGYSITETANSGTNTLLLGDVDPDDVQMYTDYHGNLFVKYSSTDTVEILAATQGSAYESTAPDYVQQIAFQDGTVWDLTSGVHLTAQNANASVYGTAGSDVIEAHTGGGCGLFGYDGNDTLIAHGSDGLNGGAGDDTYVLASGATGAGVYESASSGSDTIQGIPTGAYTWTDFYGDLMYGNAAHTTIYLTIYNGSYSSTTGVAIGSVEEADFTDNSTQDLTAGLTFTAGGNSQGFYGTTYGDTFIASATSASFHGYGGDDTYTVGAGNGTTTIYENASQGTDTVSFHGIDPGDVTITTDMYGQLHLKYSSTDEVLLSGSLDSTDGVVTNVEQVTFDDGAHTSWDLTAGLSLAASGTWAGLYGTSGADTLTATGYGNFLYAYSGADTLVAGGANGYLYGGTGADTFHFTNASDSNNVADFSVSDGDKLDFSSILTGYDPMTDTLSDFITKTESGGNTLFSVDIDGTGTGHSMTQVASIAGVTGLDALATLISNGTVIV